MSLAAALASAYGASPRGWSGFLSRADFVSDLLYTAIPQRASSGVTASFTRATTGSVQDHEGVLRTAIAGEARFTGARRVRNLLPSSESFATGWQAPGGGSVSANAILSPIGTLTADALIEDGTTAFHRINHASVTRTSGQVIAVSVYAKYAGRNLFMNWNSFCNATGAFNLQTGEVTQGAGVASIEALDDGWYRCTVIGTCTTTGADNGYLQLTPTNVSGSYAGDGVSGAYFWGVQLEDITGRADQTTPSEYVSVGVPGDWLGDEHVTNGTFDTDTTGWTAVNSTLSVVSGKLRVTNVGANAGYAYQAITTVVGTKYVVSTKVTVGTSASWGVYVGNSPGSGAAGFTGTTSGTFSSEFTATATTTYISPINTQAVDGRYTDFDNISVKPALYHGAGVDGVKYFDTDLSGNPLTTLKGYLAEGARTNLCLRSEDYTTTWATTAGISVVANQYTAPNGTSTMDQLKTVAGNTQHYLSQGGITYTAAPYTHAEYLKYDNHRYVGLAIYDGSTNNMAVFDLLNGTTGAVSAGVTSKIEPTAISGLYRCSITATPVAIVGFHVFITMNSTNTATLETWNAAGTEKVGVWGAQLELGSFASSYIPTTTVAVARNADVLTYTGGDIPNLKTICAAFKRESGVSSVGVIAALSNGTINEYAAPTMQSATNMRFVGVDGGVLQWATSASNAYAAGATSKVVQSTATNDIKMAKDGVGQSADTTATLPTIDRLDVGHLTGSYQLSGNVGPIYGWTRNLSQSEVNAITA